MKIDSRNNPCIFFPISFAVKARLLHVYRLPPEHSASIVQSLNSYFLSITDNLTASLLSCQPQIAAVEKPTIHLWETGITRITRHPQFVGQLIWCVAHTGMTPIKY